jgi:hypothetical protein
MTSYKLILESTSGHLSDDPSGSIKTVRWPKYMDVISRLFPAETRRRRHEGRWTPNTMNRLYYEPSQPSSFSSLRRLEDPARKRGIGTRKARDWLLGQDAYTA